MRPKIILAIGGAVIKTARLELRKVVEKGKVDVLIHNGGSLFHDFQLATEEIKGHSHPLDELLEDYEVNRHASGLVWDWIRSKVAPESSITRLAEDMGKDVLMFTALGADFWQLFDTDWGKLGLASWFYFHRLCQIMASPFHFINMGSAVIHPEVFTKALAVVKPKDFRATVVDFKEMYRPRTRVAKYGEYCECSHKDFLKAWAKVGLPRAIKLFKNSV
jgi:hypothetical protein